MRQSIRLGSVAGIPVGLNWGMLLIAAFYVFNLAAGILPVAVPGSSIVTYWVTAVVAVTLFFVSILAHELGHSLVAQRNGIKVNAITLWLLGGVAELDREPDSAGAEFRVAIAGPAVSVGLAVLFGAVWFVASPLIGGTVFSFAIGYLAAINVVLAVFNMFPAAPLDGGRVLAALLWHRSGNRHAARAGAAKAGQVVGTLMIIVGVVALFSGQGTILTVLLGWFIRSGATNERRRAEQLDNVSSSDLATATQPLVAPLSAGITISGLESMSSGYDRDVAFPVTGLNGLAGIVSSAAVHTVRPDQRHLVVIDDLLIPWGRFTSARVGEEMPVIIDRARTTGKDHVLVYDAAGRQVGIVSLHDFFAAA